MGQGIIGFTQIKSELNLKINDVIGHVDSLQQCISALY